MPIQPRQRPQVYNPIGASFMGALPPAMRLPQNQQPSFWESLLQTALTGAIEWAVPYGLDKIPGLFSRGNSTTSSSPIPGWGPRSRL